MELLSILALPGSARCTGQLREQLTLPLAREGAFLGTIARNLDVSDALVF
jgi:hypothetical protein